ncbi:hypothetical protein Y1Q_0006468 [Alligator mississippiensis]|uniref:Uncharacterized protein n=1 Tax=Alligator mississippiensis TaxID=8496 RepID=A0A151MVH8_ALLMI|nr:hypothetical protein Y1Q_0006468 [Alligator mississippiensis]
MRGLLEEDPTESWFMEMFHASSRQEQIAGQTLLLGRGMKGPPGMYPDDKRIRLLGGIPVVMLLEPWLFSNKKWERDRALQASSWLLVTNQEEVYYRTSP